MPAGPRVRANNVYGTVSDNPLLIAAVSFTSLGLSLLPAISGQHAVIVLDPKRVFGEPEIIVVTSHLAMGTTATITRAQYGTVARQHPQGTAWAHVPVNEDWTMVLTSGTLPGNPYAGQEVFETDLNKFVARDAANAVWVDTLPLGAWVTYVPSNTNVTVGNGTQTARFTRSGRMIVVSYNLVFGTTTSFGGIPQFGLPVAAQALLNAIGAVRLIDAGSLVRPGATMNDITVNDVRITSTDTATNGVITTNNPWVWGTSDGLSFVVTYEAAT